MQRNRKDAKYSSPKRPRILFLTNGSHQGCPDVATTFLPAIEQGGYNGVCINLEDDIDRLTDAVVVHRPTLVWSLVQEVWGDASLFPAVAGLLDLYGYVYVGSGPTALAMCEDRGITHVLLQHAGLPVTPFAIVRDIDHLAGFEQLPVPQIVTQVLDDVYDEEKLRSLLSTVEAVRAHCCELAREFELPFMVESYLPGQRVQACVVGNEVLEVLPLTEVITANDHEESEFAVQTANLRADATGRIREYAKRAFRALELRDVGQVDFVVDPMGGIYIVDVRPLANGFGLAFQCAAEQTAGGLPRVLQKVARTCHKRLSSQDLVQYPLPIETSESGPGEEAELHL